MPREPLASRAGIEAVTPLNQEMLHIEQGADPKLAPELSFRWLSQQMEERGCSYEAFMQSLGY